MDEIKFYTIPKTDKGIELFLDLFWYFHDFRIYEVHYYPKNDCIDLILEYDSRELKVLLRFEGSAHMNYIWQDFEYDWMYGASICITDNKRLRWINTEEFNDATDSPDGLFWISADKITWSIVDDEGKPKAFSFKDLHPSWIKKKQVESGEYEINEAAFLNQTE